MQKKWFVSDKSSLGKIADAIRAKNKSEGKIRFLDGFKTEIAKNNIYAQTTGSGGSSATTFKAVRFIDFDGTTLYEFSEEEFLALEALPEYTQSHAGLVFKTWNYTLADIQTELSINKKCDIGACMIPTDGKTHLKINLNLCGGKDPYLGLYLSGSAEIDWGDGSEIESITGNSTSSRKDILHHYRRAGKYEIIIDIISGSCYLKGGYYSSYSRREDFGCYALWNGQYYYAYNNNLVQYCTAITEAYLGNKMYAGTYAFSGCENLKLLTLSQSCSDSNLIAACDSLECFILPRGYTTCGSFNFSWSFALKAVSLPRTITSVSTYYWSTWGRQSILTRFLVPSSVTSATTGNSESVLTMFSNIKESTLLYKCNTSAGGHYSNASWIQGDLVLTADRTTALQKGVSFSNITSLKTAGKQFYGNGSGYYDRCNLSVGSKCTRVDLSDGFWGDSTRFTDGSISGSYNELYLPDNLTFITKNTISSSNLKYFKMPSAIQEFFATAFSGCSNLIHLDLSACSTPPILDEESLFVDSRPNLKYIIPYSSLDLYLADSKWTKLKSNFIYAVKGSEIGLGATLPALNSDGYEILWYSYFNLQDQVTTVIDTDVYYYGVQGTRLFVKNAYKDLVNCSIIMLGDNTVDYTNEALIPVNTLLHVTIIPESSLLVHKAYDSTTELVVTNNNFDLQLSNTDVQLTVGCWDTNILPVYKILSLNSWETIKTACISGNGKAEWVGQIKMLEDVFIFSNLKGQKLDYRIICIDNTVGRYEKLDGSYTSFGFKFLDGILIDGVYSWNIFSNLPYYPSDVTADVHTTWDYLTIAPILDETFYSMLPADFSILLEKCKFLSRDYNKTPGVVLTNGSYLFLPSWSERFKNFPKDSGNYNRDGYYPDEGAPYTYFEHNTIRDTPPMGMTCTYSTLRTIGYVGGWKCWPAPLTNNDAFVNQCDQPGVVCPCWFW